MEKEQSTNEFFQYPNGTEDTRKLITCLSTNKKHFMQLVSAEKTLPLSGGSVFNEKMLH